MLNLCICLLLFVGVFVLVVVVFVLFVQVVEEVSLYIICELKLIQLFIDVFMKQSGVKVNMVFVKDGLFECVKVEGVQLLVDVLMMVDVGNLFDFVDGGVMQLVCLKVFDDVIFVNLCVMNGDWYVLLLCDCVLYVEKDLKVDVFCYEDFVDLKWKGKVCICLGQYLYNIVFVVVMIVYDGEVVIEIWLCGVKVNLVCKVIGGDCDVVCDIFGGICDVGFVNVYYVGYMKYVELGSDVCKWGDVIKVVCLIFVNVKSGGMYVNISGVMVVKYVLYKVNVVKLFEYLVLLEVQVLYVQVNYEYLVCVNVKFDLVIVSFGMLKVDLLLLVDIVKYCKQVSQFVDKVGFDN